MISVEVEVEAGDWARAGDVLELCRRAAEATACLEPALAAGEPSAAILLTDDAALRRLNRDLRGEDKPTNVLSFPAPPLAAAPAFLGDVALGYETVAREAAAAGRPMAHHLTHLVVHALLHLVGHDHMDDAEADRMEGLEARVLARLGMPDPHREPD